MISNINIFSTSIDIAKKMMFLTFLVEASPDTKKNVFKIKRRKIKPPPKRFPTKQRSHLNSKLFLK